MTAHLPLLLLFVLALAAHGSAAGGERWISGWRDRASGESIPYESPDPRATHALLVRSLREEQYIEWTTEAVPADLGEDALNVMWLFGIIADADRREWRLDVDGVEYLRFRNPSDTEVLDWTVTGESGATLRFRGTLVDRYDDIFGYASLQLPASACTPGKPLTIRVTGESAERRTWYMTFMAPVEESMQLTPRSALLRGEDGAWQPLVLEVRHLGEETGVKIATSAGEERAERLVFGLNEFVLRLPELRESSEVVVRVTPDGEAETRLSVVAEPVKHWMLYLVQHTHTDIGYTRPQTEILPEHLRYIDYALDYCDRTDDFPDDARFRWTCEASWAVREYLRCRTPEQLERLKRRVLEGRIELTAMFFNMSEVMDEGSYSAYLYPVRDFQEAGLPVVTAMQNDINGAAWCLADHFSKIGVRYLTMGQHGHRALKPFELATSFWWESPAGNRLLSFRADHYNTGNRWGVHTAKLASVEDGLFRYLAEMEGKGYPYERVAVQYSGYLTDNSPPALAGNELIKAWNEKYAWPRLRSSVAGDFLAWVEEEHGDELPVVRQAWPDWWTDGFGSAARESAAARVTQAEMTATEGLLAMEVLMGIAVPEDLERGISLIRDSLIFYGEHTFGAAESVTDPLSENSMVQWAEKSAYVWEAVKSSALLREKALGRLQSRLAASDVPTLTVVNTLAYPRGGGLEVYIDHEVLPPEKRASIVDDAGRTVAAQLLRSRSDGSYWALQVPELPAFGYASFRIEVEAGEARRTPAVDATAVLENDDYRLEVSPETGALASLFDKELGLELLDTDAEWKAGQVVYETLGNRAQLESFMLEDYARVAPSDVELLGRTDGESWQSLRVRSHLPCCEPEQSLELEVRLFHDEKRVELCYTIRKRRNFEPEALYVALPFGLTDATVAYETLGGVAAPDKDLIPGAASDWQTLQSFAAVRSDSAQIVVSCDEIPLVQFGDINIGKYQRVALVQQPHIYSWVMNNYWTTNYKASQEGEFRWTYALTSSRDTSNSFASRFGWSHRIPLFARVLPAGAERTPTVSASLLELDAPNLVLVSARPATRGRGVILHLREVEGRETETDLRLAEHLGDTAVSEVSVLEDELTQVEGRLSFSPYESVFLRLTPPETER